MTVALIAGGIILLLALIGAMTGDYKTRRRERSGAIALWERLPEATHANRFAARDGRTAIGIDASTRQVHLLTAGNPTARIISPDRIIEVSIVQDNVATTTIRTNNSVGRAVVGGALLGGVGALVGAASAGSTATSVDVVRMLNLRLVIDDLAASVFDVAFLPSTGAQKTSPGFIAAERLANDWLGKLKVITQ